MFCHSSRNMGLYDYNVVGAGSTGVAGLLHIGQSVKSC